MAKLSTTVHVLNEAGGSEQFARGTDESDLPGWARDAITNPDVWDDDHDPVSRPVPGPSQTESDTESDEDLSLLSKAELQARADDAGVEYSHSDTKADLVAKLGG